MIAPEDSLSTLFLRPGNGSSLRGLGESPGWSRRIGILPLVGEISDNLSRLLEEINRAARDCGRDPGSVKLLAVSKTFPPRAVEEASRAGQILFGENRVQEAEAKIAAVQTAGIRWHLIGHLQSNKARRAAELFDAVQSVDSEKIARKLGNAADGLSKDLPVFIQVNAGDEPQKHGVPPESVASLAKVIDTFPRLRLSGLMAIPPFHEDPRPHFKRLRRLLEELNRGRVRPIPDLSMGMSADWEVAVQEGATLLRIGTAIFGERSP